MQTQSGVFSRIRDALQLSVIGRFARVQDKPFERIPSEFTMASKCPKCEKTVYFGKFLLYSVAILKMHSPLCFGVINDMHAVLSIISLRRC